MRHRGARRIHGGRTDDHRRRTGGAGVRPRRPARQVPGRARQAPAPRRQRAVRRGHRPVRPLPRRPVRRADRARPAVRRGRRRRRRRRLRRAARRRPPEGGRDHRRPHHREGRRLRRHVVLEPLPGRAVRRRVVHLPPAAGGDRLRPEGEVHPGAGDPRAQPQHRRALRPLRRGAVPDRGHDAAWDDDVVALARGDEPRRRAAGPLRLHGQRAAAPPEAAGIPGIEGFQGHSFHTSRWDYDYTGGDSEGNLTKLAGKRVGIIGTGATAVQVVPHVGAAAEQLYVFQRTPSSIDVRNNRPTDPEWAASLEPGWQKRRMENFNNLVSGIPEPEDLVGDGWTDIIGKLLLRMRQARGRRHVAGRHGQRPSSSPTSRRWSDPARASTRSSTTRTRPRR